MTFLTSVVIQFSTLITCKRQDITDNDDNDDRSTLIITPYLGMWIMPIFALSIRLKVSLFSNIFYKDRNL